MPAGRIILKSISESNKLAKLKTDGARLLYTWLIPHLDINGCFNGDPVVVGGKVFTRLGKLVKEIDDYLADLENNGLIIRYEANNDTFLFVPDFKEKQPLLNKDKEAKGKIPLPTPDQLQTNSRLTPPKVKESKVKDKLSKANSPAAKPPVFDFDTLWDKYPRKLGKEKAKGHFRASVKDSEDYERISRALDNYLVDIKTKGTEERFIRHGSTWFNGWQDWVDYKPIKADRPPVYNPPENKEPITPMPENVKKMLAQVGTRI